MIIDRCDSLSYLYNQSRFLHSLPCKNSRTNRYYWYKKRSRCKDRCLAHTHLHLKIKMCKFTSKYINSLLQSGKNEIKQLANRLERQYPNSSDSSFSMRKQPTCFPGKWRQRNARRNSILMTCITQIWIVLLIRQVWRETSQVWVVTGHRYGISALVLWTSFQGNQRWCREMWTVSTGYSSLAGLHFQKRSFNELFCYLLTYK